MMNAGKYLILIITTGLQLSACSKNIDLPGDENDTPQELSGINLNIATSGSYPAGTDRIYVDEKLNAVAKADAKYYLEKELLGRALVPNDEPTFDYWKSKQYFKDTPIINYIYKYFDVEDNKLFFAANASELEGTTQYIFDGLAFWYHKNEIVSAKTGYATGELDGDFIIYNEDGTVKAQYGYDMGRQYSNTQEEEDIYEPMIGLWEAELYNDANFERRTQAYDMKADGSMEFYHNIYYNHSSGTPNWEITDYGKNSKATGSWKFLPQSDSTGILELYYKGEIAQKNDVKLLSSDEMQMTSSYVAPMFKDEYNEKTLYFQRSK